MPGGACPARSRNPIRHPDSFARPDSHHSRPPRAPCRTAEARGHPHTPTSRAAPPRASARCLSSIAATWPLPTPPPRGLRRPVLRPLRVPIRRPGRSPHPRLAGCITPCLGPLRVPIRRPGRSPHPRLAGCITPCLGPLRTAIQRPGRSATSPPRGLYHPVLRPLRVPIRRPGRSATPPPRGLPRPVLRPVLASIAAHWLRDSASVRWQTVPPCDSPSPGRSERRPERYDHDPTNRSSVMSTTGS
jgi:hypothetical protein